MVESPTDAKTPDLEIRELEIDDLAAVFHLGERAFTSAVPNLYRTWDEYEVTGLFNSDPELCLVAHDRGPDVLAGFALGTTVTKPRSAWKYGYLLWMAVADEYRQRRVGQRLVRRLIERMVELDVRILLVDTDAENDVALRFFHRLGFEHPQEHVYLRMNLDARRRRRKKTP